MNHTTEVSQLLSSENEPNTEPQPNQSQPHPRSDNLPSNPNRNAMLNAAAMLNQPMLQSLAADYTQQLGNEANKYFKQEIGQYLSLQTLKYYFAVDTNYVKSKLMLLFYPFNHLDWTVPYRKDDGPVPPRFAINAPDLYIPTVAYLTFVVIASAIIGLNRIGQTASSILAWFLLELAILKLTLYLAAIQCNLRTLDLIAYIGYKFVGITASVIVGFIGGKALYFLMVGYSNLTLAFFLLRSMRSSVLSCPHQVQPQADSIYLRRLYFLVFVALAQPLLSLWHSNHLVRSSTL